MTLAATNEATLSVAAWLQEELEAYERGQTLKFKFAALTASELEFKKRYQSLSLFDI